MTYNPTPEDVKAESEFDLTIWMMNVLRDNPDGVPITIDVFRGGVMEVARCFIGVHEIHNTNSGYWVDKFIGAGRGRSGDAWCCGFVQFVYEQASKALGLPDLMPYDTVGTQALASWFKKNSLCVTSITDIRPGDVVVWTNGRGSGKGHCGIITGIDDKYIYTIEGNTSTGSKFDRDGGYVAGKKYLKSEFAIGVVSNERYINCVGSAELMYRRVVK